eukprot:scaffold79771_cov28-Tisochrysis_lutea.AAC.2
MVSWTNEAAWRLHGHSTVDPTNYQTFEGSHGHHLASLSSHASASEIGRASGLAGWLRAIQPPYVKVCHSPIQPPYCCGESP